MSNLPVIASQFDPRGESFAYVSVALDRHRIGVESVSQSGIARSVGLEARSLVLESSQLRVTALQWVGKDAQEVQNVAVGLNNGEIWIYAPAANQIVSKLASGSAHAVRDIDTFRDTLWSCDADDTLYRFSLVDFTLQTHFKVEGCSDLQKLCIIGPERVLVASHAVSLVDTVAKQVVRTYPGHVSSVTHLQMLSEECFLTAAAMDRFVNVYNTETGATRSVLVAQSNVVQVSHFQDKTVAVTTEDGALEVFPDALVHVSNKKRKVMSKHSSSLIKIARPQSAEALPVLNAALSADVLTYCWLEAATLPYFDKLQWRDLGATEIIEKARPSAKSTMHKSTYGDDVAAATSYAEGNATVTSGDNFKYVTEAIAEVEREGGEEESLADMLESANLQSKSSLSKRAKKKATMGTLSVVLSQALQSNDHSLMESVLNNRDEKVIKGTITRLQPVLAVVLLERLAERIARQTNRQGPLNVWVKWCLIIHGGYLARMPNLTSSLASLHSTLRKRCELLPRLKVLETRLECAINQISVLSVSDTDLANGHFIPEENEDEVEYNEELDDAGLIEDGELDIASEDEDAEFSSEELADGSRTANGENLASGNESDVDADEEGYSDVEVN
ncbi:LAMI_0D10660g1_1 [Lachancea mirantina]|uniref:LAMI_0D10660g1_1 n=1 Tax=Lachancea mirantina TaxID=1230905 RepID=A0A1G4JEA7_9SACH|nr:LAMI_0D10660g1_1 [Lachancea mirantina]